MYCPKCGEQIDDEAVVCPKCGCETGVKTKKNSTDGESKTGAGFLMGLFLGIIGLIIGICIYPSESKERKTFVDGWITSFIISIIIGVFIWVIIAGSSL